jgi:hypothetical protein
MIVLQENDFLIPSQCQTVCVCATMLIDIQNDGLFNL